MTRPRFQDVLAAETAKLRTLPAVPLSVLGTVLAGALVSAAAAGVPSSGRGGATAVDVATGTVPLLQAGLVLVGVWPVAQEHTGRQGATTLRAVPHRPTLLAATAAAAAALVALTAALSVGAALLGATTVVGPAPVGAADARALLGAAVALTLIGLLAHAVALLVRHLVPALVGTLVLVLVLPPVLAGATEQVRWLPGRAAGQLYDRTDTVLSPTTGALVALAWVVLVGGVGAVLAVRRNA
ncbi:MAG TPA: hypothetical protein VGC67_15020 [Cellulomonas sp.]